MYRGCLLLTNNLDTSIGCQLCAQGLKREYVREALQEVPSENAAQVVANTIRLTPYGTQGLIPCHPSKCYNCYFSFLFLLLYLWEFYNKPTSWLQCSLVSSKSPPPTHSNSNIKVFYFNCIYSHIASHIITSRTYTKNIVALKYQTFKYTLS